MLTYCKTELRLELSEALCDNIFNSLVVKGEAGLRVQQLPRLKMVLASQQQPQPQLQQAAGAPHAQAQGVVAHPAGANAGGSLPRPPG